MSEMSADATGESELRLENTTFLYFMERCRAVTQHWFDENGAWPLDTQIAHAHSEVSEVYQAIRHNEGRFKMLEEICDAVLASLTMAHVAGFHDDEIVNAMEYTLQKIERRAGLRP